METRETLRSYLQKNLTPHRFNHSLGVEKMAIQMAKRFKLSEEECAIAGLAHDICREKNSDELFKITDKEHQKPILLHGEAGAIILERDFNIRNEQILNSVKYHISGHETLDTMGKIIFASDFIEEGRTHISPYERHRLFSLELDDMVLEIALSIREHLHRKGDLIHKDLNNFIEVLS